MKIIRFLFTSTFMGILFILLAIAMAFATFIENDFGSEVARSVIYDTKWFEGLFLLLAINLTGRIINNKLYKPAKLTVFLFHAAFLVMILGAFITRYFGYEGMMHIPEGEEQNVVSSMPESRTLPFSIRLNDFVVERYPGSDSPSGFRSDVTLIDTENKVEKQYSIFMNNILKYRGYRFYQSSYDQDEKGTILSVNYDRAGILVTYTGYGLLIIFIILSLLNKKSLFHTVSEKHWTSPFRKGVPTLILMLGFSGNGFLNAQRLVPDKAIADDFGRILVQDQKGRTKPLFTLSSDILRKVTGKNEFNGLTPMQVYLGLFLDFDYWKDVQIIKVSSSELRRQLGLSGKYASFSDIVDLNNGGRYKIATAVEAAYAKAPGERNRFDKDVMKVDERLNICYMVNRGDFIKVFPLKNGTDGWGTAPKALAGAVDATDSLYLSNIVVMFAGALRGGDSATTSEIINSVISYQQKFSEYDLPSEKKINAEILYYKLKVFEKLFPFYATIGILMLSWLIYMVISVKKEASKVINGLTLLLFLAFLTHTLTLALRWYISGHSPMSNGYESMIFISWVTLLAGFLFRNRSAFALSATAVLASMTLMVAHLSFLDPEITNLVPVLRSYWLTLHVSVITGSYGFLGLGAILSLITMILLALSNNKNKQRIGATIDELTVINYKTITLGLYFLTIGTFLGAIWANESWGRYWGWDPKETWSLITIIIYSLVIHSRMIPGMKDIYTFNAISLFAFSSVLMTYFGVNYYLSGLHSYANGDSVGVPGFVYITAGVLVTVSVVAYRKYSKIQNS